MENLNNKTEKMTLKEFYQSNEWTCYCNDSKITQDYINYVGLKYSPKLHTELKEQLKEYFVELEKPKTGNNKPDYLVSFINRLGSRNA